MINKSIAATALLLSGLVFAQGSGVYFSHKNWEVVCDNTTTCRAAGYSDGDESAGSVLLIRKAGPGTALTGVVTLGDIESDATTATEKLTLWIDGKSMGSVKPAQDDNWRLSERQVRALVGAVKGSGSVEFRGGPAPFVLSGDGAYAALLKMDDVQGRTGTPGALTKTGNKPESGVPAAVPPPVIQAVKVSGAPERQLSEREASLLKPKLLATLQDKEACDRLFPAPDEQDVSDGVLTLTPLDDRHALLSTQCWLAAYNAGRGYWVIDNALKQAPVLVTESGTSYSDGVIDSSQKGRGIGDCFGTGSWVWDGQAFRKSSESTTGMCRYVRLGGTWDLPTFVAEVKPAR